MSLALPAGGHLVLAKMVGLISLLSLCALHGGLDITDGDLAKMHATNAAAAEESLEIAQQQRVRMRPKPPCLGRLGDAPCKGLARRARRLQPAGKLAEPSTLLAERPGRQAACRVHDAQGELLTLRAVDLRRAAEHRRGGRNAK